MKARKYPELKEYRLNQLRARILSDRGDKVHASDLDLCPLKSGYRRFHPNPPPVPEKSLLFFASGIMAEHWLYPERVEPKEKDGIIGSPDTNEELFGYGEIKSNRGNQDYFDPITKYPHWTYRLKTYCYLFDVLKWTLEVFFWNGNRKDQQIGYDAWEIEFTKEELLTHWTSALKRKAVVEEIFKAVKDGTCPPLEKVWLQSWECRECEFAPSICHFKNKKKEDRTMQVLGEVREFEKRAL